jgi:hypothetical protein
MDLIIVIEIFYLISAVLCAILLPFETAMRKRDSSDALSALPLRYSMTYAHIACGFLLGLIPVANTGLVILSIFYYMRRFIDRLDRINVVKQKEE